MAKGLSDLFIMPWYFFGEKVELGSMYLTLISSVVILIVLYIAMHALWSRKQG